MLFKISYTVERLDISSKDILNLNLKGEENIHISLRSLNAEERSKDNMSVKAFIDIQGDFEPSKKSLPIFDALIDGKRPPKGEKAASAKDMIFKEGPLYDLDYYPNPFISFVDKIHNKLSSTGMAAIDILRWKYALEGPPSPLRCETFGNFLCSKDNGNTWHRIPNRLTIHSQARFYTPFLLHKVNHTEIIDLIEAASREPLGHELLREAKELKFSSPRSAVLIAVSALEVAAKSVILKKIPEAAWLLESIQSPPLVSILIDYFPKLFQDEKQFYKPERHGIIKIILDAVNIRNELAHKGASPPSYEKVSEIIDAVQELLWVCDYYSGHKWAELYIQSSSA